MGTEGRIRLLPVSLSCELWLPPLGRRQPRPGLLSRNALQEGGISTRGRRASVQHKLSNADGLAVCGLTMAGDMIEHRVRPKAPRARIWEGVR
jgi:hypothetical protein